MVEKQQQQVANWGSGELKCWPESTIFSFYLMQIVCSCLLVALLSLGAVLGVPLPEQAGQGWTQAALPVVIWHGLGDSFQVRRDAQQ